MPRPPKDERYQVYAEERCLEVGGEEWLRIGAILKDILEWWAKRQIRSERIRTNSTHVL